MRLLRSIQSSGGDHWRMICENYPTGRAHNWPNDIDPQTPAHLGDRDLRGAFFVVSFDDRCPNGWQRPIESSKIICVPYCLRH
jgi:hypothetical protein